MAAACATTAAAIAGAASRCDSLIRLAPSSGVTAVQSAPGQAQPPMPETARSSPDHTSVWQGLAPVAPDPRTAHPRLPVARASYPVSTSQEGAAVQAPPPPPAASPPPAGRGLHDQRPQTLGR